MSEIVADNISIIQSDELEGVTRIVTEYYQPKICAFYPAWSPFGNNH